jgi:hypothetical protein
MRTTTLATVTALGLAFAIASPAEAQEAVSTYDVKYEEVANNCASIGTGIVMKSGKLRIRQEKKQLFVDIEGFPVMSGTPSKTGAVRATSKIAPTRIQKVQGKFQAAGKADGSLLSLVFVGEYYTEEKKPLCTQSWNITGTRDDGGEAKPPAAAPAPATPAK